LAAGKKIGRGKTVQGGKPERKKSQMTSKAGEKTARVVKEKGVQEPRKKKSVGGRKVSSTDGRGTTLGEKKKAKKKELVGDQKLVGCKKA